MANNDSYRDGSLRIRYLANTTWDDADEEPSWVDDDDMEIIREGSIVKRVAALPHQCDSWTIGDAERVRALIDDLQRLLPALEVS